VGGHGTEARMSEKQKRIFNLVHSEARRRAMSSVSEAPAGFVVTVEEPNRTLEQNAAQWPILEAFSQQLLWPVDGEMVRMSTEEWKDVLTAAFKGETVRLARGLNGGVVMLGLRTSKFGKKSFSDWLEFLHATAALRGVTVYADEAPA
jgi:NinB protein